MKASRMQRKKEWIKQINTQMQCVGSRKGTRGKDGGNETLERRWKRCKETERKKEVKSKKQAGKRNSIRRK